MTRLSSYPCGTSANSLTASHCLIASMNSIRAVHGKLCRLLYTMNKNTRISVQTPVGTTDERDTGEGVGQGTLEGALVSAVHLDSGVNEHFPDSEYEIS